MPKKIILCFDGTCNDPADAVQGNGLFGLGGPEDNGITNVLKLHLMLGGDLKKKPQVGEQINFYYPGVGTYGNWFQKLRNTAFSPEQEDVSTIIKNAFKDLYTSYESDDELFIFGFSRGAAIARRFASVLPDIFEALDNTRVPRVRFLGVFDTVAAINKPNLREEKKPASDVVFENRTISACIDEALHILALDEKRIPFYPTLMNQEDRVTEIWFPGAHADVGGGYRYDGLSDGALQFMLDELQRRKLGLRITPPTGINYSELSDDDEVDIDFQDVIVQPNYLGKSHQQEAITKIKKSFLNDRQMRINVNDFHSTNPPTVHHTVIDRIHDKEEYRPNSLSIQKVTHPYTGKIVPHQVWYSPTQSKEFNSLSEHKSGGREALIRLEPGEKHEFSVYANQKFNPSGVLVNEGEQYTFSTDMNQNWFDANIECGPDGWDRSDIDAWFGKEWFIKNKENERRCPSAKWFEVVCAINKSEDSIFKILDLIQRGNAYTVPVKGELFSFANDLDSMYGNNLGAITITVSRQ